MDATQPCGWAAESCGCSAKCLDGLPPHARDFAVDAAALVVWAATGRRYGLCEVEVLPCNPRPALPLWETFPVAGGRAGYDPWGAVNEQAGPVLQGGTWRNTCGGGCRCRATCEVPLPGPVATVLDVTVDGEVVPLSAVQVHNRNLLVRTDGDCWPTCTVFDAEVPGFVVGYELGQRIPTGIQRAFEMLTCEYAQLCAGGVCRLPGRLTSLTRQGIEVQVEQVTTDQAKRLRTGIKLVDDLIDADNPHALTTAPTVMSPDLPEQQARVVTWAGGS